MSRHWLQLRTQAVCALLLKYLETHDPSLRERELQEEFKLSSHEHRVDEQGPEDQSDLLPLFS